MQFFDKSGKNLRDEEIQTENLNLNEDDNGSDVNKQNADYYRRLMKESQTNKDDYYDKNNPIVKIILLLLLAFIVLGSIYIFTR